MTDKTEEDTLATEINKQFREMFPLGVPTHFATTKRKCKTCGKRLYDSHIHTCTPKVTT